MFRAPWAGSHPLTPTDTHRVGFRRTRNLYTVRSVIDEANEFCALQFRTDYAAFADAEEKQTPLPLHRLPPAISPSR